MGNPPVCLCLLQSGILGILQGEFPVDQFVRYDCDIYYHLKDCLNRKNTGKWIFAISMPDFRLLCAALSPKPRPWWCPVPGPRSAGACLYKNNEARQPAL